MSKSRKLALVVAASLAAIGGAVGIGGFSSAWGGGGGEIRLLSDSEVIVVIDKAVAAKDEPRAGEVSNELVRRWNTADRSVLANAAADRSLTIETRGLMIDMLAGDAAQLPSELRSLLANPDFDQELKTRIIATSTFTPEDSDLLAAFATRSDITGTWVDASEISSMRCDGVIEYVYEWSVFRVYGNDTLWDLTKVSSSNREHHSGTLVTPQSQAQSYLTLVTTALP